MIQVNDQEFDHIISLCMDELPQEYITGMKNVAIVMADYPSEEQRHKLQLRGDQSLFGLYEGIPLTARGSGFSGMLPDKITLFKGPLQEYTHDFASFREQVKRTLWHEIAHHYGLNHDRIDALQNKDHDE